MIRSGSSVSRSARRYASSFVARAPSSHAPAASAALSSAARRLVGAVSLEREEHHGAVGIEARDVGAQRAPSRAASARDGA